MIRNGCDLGQVKASVAGAPPTAHGDPWRREIPGLRRESGG